MGEVFEGEFVAARYVDTRPGHPGHLRCGERVVRCADCALAKGAAGGLTCTLHGAAGWFETEPEGFCSKGVARR